MRKLLVAMAALLSAGYAGAGDYHISTTLRCSQCHAMHASRAHQLNGGAVDADYSGGTPNRNLLIQDGTNETCLACHDAKAAYPDVFGANGGMVAAGTRSAGALNGTTPSHTDATYSAWMGHTLGTEDAPPGWVGIYEATPQEGFNCANCHEVHGSAAYRNAGGSTSMGLPTQKGPGNPFATAYPTYNAQNLATGTRATLVNDGTRNVTIEVNARDYQTANVSFGRGGSNGMNAYCAVCHGNFHGDANTRDLIGGVDFIRHPTSGVERLDNTLLLTTGETNLVRPAWTGAEYTSGYEAACLSCHKAHGNQRGYGLIYPLNDDGNTTIVNYEEGDAAAEADGTYPLRNLCITCHTQGR